MKDEILSCLSPQYPWGELLNFLPETDSTNTQLKGLARDGAPEGTALVSGHQTGGRGRKGRTIVTGAFTEDITLAGTALSAVGTSAYIAFCDVTGAAQWAVALSGSATVADVVIAADGSIYVSGTFADEVEFGTTAGDAIIKEGMKMDGAATVKQNASFIAHYDATGRILAVADFVPRPLAALTATGMYFPEDGDVY